MRIHAHCRLVWHLVIFILVLCGVKVFRLWCFLNSDFLVRTILWLLFLHKMQTRPYWKLLLVIRLLLQRNECRKSLESGFLCQICWFYIFSYCPGCVWLQLKVVDDIFWFFHKGLPMTCEGIKVLKIQWVSKDSMFENQVLAGVWHLGSLVNFTTERRLSPIFSTWVCFWG